MAGQDLASGQEADWEQAAIRKYSPRAIRVRASSPKLIVRNNALVTALRGVPFEETMKDRSFYGRLAENAIGAMLINAGETVFYWSERDKELDFVVQRGTDLLAVEVKMGDRSTALGLKTFQVRYPEAKPVRIGGAHADYSLEQFLQFGF